MRLRRRAAFIILSSTASLLCIQSAFATGGWIVSPLDSPGQTYETDQYKACSVMLQRANYVIYPYFHPKTGTNILDYAYVGLSNDGFEPELYCAHHNEGPDALDTEYFQSTVWRCPGRGDFKPQNQSCDITPSRNVRLNKNYCELDSNQSVGDPINLGAASVEEEALDFESAGSLPLRIKRLYRSQSMPGNLLGDGKWKFDFEYVLNISGDTANFYMPDGSRYIFAKNPQGQFSVQNNDGPIYLTVSGGFYKIKLNDGSEIIFVQKTDNSFRVATINRNDGLVQNFSYNGDSLSNISDQFGRNVYFFTSGNTNVVREAGFYLNGGAVMFRVNYTYTSKSVGRFVYNKTLISAQRSAVNDTGSPSTIGIINTVNYAYENSDYPYMMTSFADERGVKISNWSYDSSSRAVSSSLAGTLDKTDVVYGASDKSMTVTNSLGKQTGFIFTLLNGRKKLTNISASASQNTPGANRSVSYDANGNISSVTDEENRKTSFVRDQYGRPTSIIYGAQ